MKTTTLLLAVLALLCACRNKPVHTLATGPEGEERVVVSGWLAERVAFADARTYAVGDSLAAQVEVHNRTSERFAFLYRFEWFDANGLRLGASSSNWMSATIHGGETRALKDYAPAPGAVDFRLEVRER